MEKALIDIRSYQFVVIPATVEIDWSIITMLKDSPASPSSFHVTEYLVKKKSYGNFPLFHYYSNILDRICWILSHKITQAAV